MTHLEEEVARAICPNVVGQFPEEWLPEARRVIRAMASCLRQHDRASGGCFAIHSITANWLLEQISKDQ
jgi:hypothetical protein